MNVAHNNFVNDCLIELSPLGLFWPIDTPGLVYDRNGRPFKAGTKGVSDIVGCLRTKSNQGQFVAVECKTGTGALTTEQRCYRDAVIRAGGIFITARSIDDLAPIKAVAA